MTSPMTETPIQKQILDALNLSPKIGKAIRINTGGRTRRTNLAPTGTPDIFGWFARGRVPTSNSDYALSHNPASYRGQAFWIEVKLPGKNPTPAQAKFIEHANKTGAVAFVARSLEDIQWMI